MTSIEEQPLPGLPFNLDELVTSIKAREALTEQLRRSIKHDTHHLMRVLAASGMSTREIAERLDTTVRHVGSVTLSRKGI